MAECLSRSSPESSLPLTIYFLSLLYREELSLLAFNFVAASVSFSVMVVSLTPTDTVRRKIMVLDLDETLIHSHHDG